jgi:putative transposase
VGVLCGVSGMTRQNYYKQRIARERVLVDESLMMELIRRERSRHPRIGGRKLLFLIQPDLESAGVSMGRDRFFELLRGQDLLIERRRRVARTTNSLHGFRVYPNQAKELELSSPHQLWVSDITYIRTLEGFMFLSLVMDAFSRSIVGYDCSDSLEMEGALRALSMALRQLPQGSQTMHHSDRGCQYCCHAYIGKLIEHGIAISMTQENHCYENSQAERLNGILKQEYGLGETFARKSDVKAAAQESVTLYNHYRPHGSLKNQTPMAVHEKAA